MDTVFLGEHLLPGKLGQFFVVLSFGTALLATISYYFHTLKDKADDSWLKIARTAYLVNLLAVIGIGSCLYYIIYNHLFEYHYAWAHSSRSLPVYYIISSFWEGQEGSFWLWTFWQSVLGLILFFRAKSWESPVMTIVMLSQVFLASMLLGVEVLGIRVGSSPFILLRDAMQAPIFSRPDYLSLISDGNGLNPLLQNYWMVIHPPTLFLGFAAMVVPFAFAVAGLWQKRYAEWINVALPWALFAVMILGAGIIMGSFWAYEALNFGGFWAWDPVENASIFPWITLIAAVHVMIAYKNSGHAYFTSVFLTVVSFVLVLYASFLTRSGILGESSVHSFTDLGMFWQLFIYIGVFKTLSYVLIFVRWKELPISKKEEETYSREFLLFIGALILTLACLQILITTSIPVFNKAFGTNIAPPTNVIQHYNKWQLPFALIIALISGFAQFLKYKNTDAKKFYPAVIRAVIIAAVLTAFAGYVTGIYPNPMFLLLTFAALFSVVANGNILYDAIKGKWKLAGSAMAHIGFGFLLIGAMVAAATSRTVSINNTGIGFGDQFAKDNNPRENIILYINEPVKMDPYTVTYLGDSVSGPNTLYRVNYKVIDEKTGKVTEDFDLYPNAQQNVKMRQIIASPDTRHYLLKDIYTHVSSVPLKKEEHEAHEGHSDEEDFGKPAIYQVSLGDTIRVRDAVIVVKSVNRNAKVQNMPLSKGDVAVALTLEVKDAKNTYQVEPIFLIKSGNTYDFGKTIDELGLKLRFTNVLPNQNKLELTVFQKPKAEKKWIVMKAIMFPYINLFWGGAILMTIGFLLSILRRKKELKTV
ncbi:MAG: heme lyase CcmF/NrfE family subunit [Sphingobacteriaceae bacterium]